MPAHQFSPERGTPSFWKMSIKMEMPEGGGCVLGRGLRQGVEYFWATVTTECEADSKIIVSPFPSFINFTTSSMKR